MLLHRLYSYGILIFGVILHTPLNSVIGASTLEVVVEDESGGG